MPLDFGLEKSGYIEVKQPSNIKRRKLKTWKRKWIVVHQMSDLAAGTFAAKIDIYPNEDSVKNSPCDKLTYILENVKTLRASSSKTHSLAFEIVENHPVLVLSAETELDTHLWMLELKQIFWPSDKEVDNIDCFDVAIVENEHAIRLSLTGEFKMSISQAAVMIKSKTDDKCVEWPLSILKRFNWDIEKGKKDVNVLFIESGPNSKTGEGMFMFRSRNAQDILLSIKRNIYIAIAKRQQRSTECSNRNRTISSTQSEERFKEILERSRSILNSTSEDGDQQSESDAMSTPPVSPHDKHIELDNEYNRLALKKSSFERSVEKQKIVAAITLTDETSGNKSHVLFDEEGYSHIPGMISENEDEKPRDVSVSKESERSTSTSSRDSGVMSTSVEMHIVVTEVPDANDGTYNGIPALATEIDKDQVYLEEYTPCGEPDKLLNDGKLTVENIDTILDLSSENCSNSENLKSGVRCKYSPAHIYSDIDHFKQFHAAAEETTSEEGFEIPRRRSDVGAKKTENDYEDLEKFRKNLAKHLGMDPAIKQPLDVPPALPERPTSLQLRRKNIHHKTKERKKHMSMITFRKSHNRTPSLSSSSSSASEADDESENRRHTISNIQSWFITKSKYNRSQLYPMIDLYAESVTIGEETTLKLKADELKTFGRLRCSSDTTLSCPNENKSLENDCVCSMPVKENKQKDMQKMSIEHEISVNMLTGDSQITAPPVSKKKTITYNSTDVAPLVELASESDTAKTPKRPPKTIIYEVDDNIGGFTETDEISSENVDPFALRFDPFPAIGKFDRPLLGEVITKPQISQNIDFSRFDMFSCKSSEKESRRTYVPQRDEFDILFGGNPWNETDQSEMLSTRPRTLDFDELSTFDPFGCAAPNSRYVNTHSKTHLIKENIHVIGENIYTDMSGKKDQTDGSEDVEYVKPSDIVL